MATNEYAFLNLEQKSNNANADTLFKISLDDLDVGLLPLNKLLDKYNGKDTKPIWELDTKLKTLKEYSAAAEQYVALQVTAKEVESTINDSNDSHKIKETQYCRLCNIEIPVIYTKNHVESATHREQLRLASHMLDRMKQQAENPLTFNSNETPKDIYYCACCNIVLYEHSQFNHTNTHKHKLCAKKEEALGKIVDVFTDQKKSPKKHNASASASKELTEESKNNFAVKQVGQSLVEVTAANGDIIAVPKEHWQGIVYIGNGYFHCNLCEVREKQNYLKQHLSDKKHKVLQSIVIKDRHANRRIFQAGEDIWYHCVLCNVTHFYQDSHIKHRDHMNKLSAAVELLRLKVPTNSKEYITKPNQNVTKPNQDDAKPHQNDTKLNQDDAKPKQNVTNPNINTNCNLKDSIIKTFDTDLLIKLGADDFMKVSNINWHGFFITKDYVLCRLCVTRFPLTLAALFGHTKEYDHSRLVKSQDDKIKRRIEPLKLNNNCIDEIILNERVKSLREEFDFMTADKDTISFVLDMEEMISVPASYGDMFVVSKQNYHGIHMYTAMFDGYSEKRFSCMVCGLFGFIGGIDVVKRHMKTQEHLRTVQSPIDCLTGFRKNYNNGPVCHCITCNKSVYNFEHHGSSEVHLECRENHDFNARKSWNSEKKEEIPANHPPIFIIIAGIIWYFFC